MFFKEARMASAVAPIAPIGPTETRRRYRREAVLGPRCPHCAGPLVFGEGCSLCPICGYSACSA